MIYYICELCKKESDTWKLCECGGEMRHPCSKFECNEPAHKSISATGYLGGVCRKHYFDLSIED
jgi:hypothetical protein